MVLIDITQPLHPSLAHWPGEPGFRSRSIHAISRGDPANVAAISGSVHTGTHMDAPRHFLRSGRPVDRVDLGACVGPCVVVSHRGPGPVDAAAVRRLDLRGRRRVLFKTRNGPLWRERRFNPDYVALSPDGAREAVRRNIRLVGIDYLSIGAPDTGAETHRVLLRQGVVILEGLRLDRVRPGPYDLIALPLRLEGLDGSPVRAVLRSPHRRGSERAR